MVRRAFYLACCDCVASGGLEMSGLVLPPAVKSIGLSTLDNRKPQSLLAAAQHNRRHPDGRGWQRKSDPTKIHLNQCLIGPDSTEGVVALQEAMMVSVGYAPKRKDYSQAFELLFTTPADFTVDYSVYFAWCLEWTQANLGRGIVLSADSHFDEGIDKKMPHLHILLAPIVGGAWAGNGFTSTRTWPELQAKFGRDIELTFGLKLAPQLKGKALTVAATAVTARLTELLAPHIDPDVLQALLKLVRRKPAGLIGPLGITGDRGGDGGAEFRRIALSSGKGGKTERRAKPYGIEPNAYGIENDPEKAIPFLCSGFAKEAPPKQATSTSTQAPVNEISEAPDQPLSDQPNADGEIKAPALNDTHDLDQIDAGQVVDVPFIETTTRHHDCDQAPERFHDGEYRAPPPALARHKRQAADQWVQSALATRSKTVIQKHQLHRL